MNKIPKITKSNYSKLFPTFKKNKIIQFAVTINEDDARSLAAEYKFRVEFFEPSSREYKIYGRNICRIF
jgi:hypothetical protein